MTCGVGVAYPLTAVKPNDEHNYYHE